MEYRSEPINLNRDAARRAMLKLAQVNKKFLKPHWWLERSPSGEKWKKRKIQQPHPILNKTGRMFNSLIFKVENDTLVAEMVDYGIFHQLGTEDMEQREWVGLTEEGLEFFIDTFLEELVVEKK